MAQDETLPAAVIEGGCESETVIAQLTDLVLPTGSTIGAATGRTAASSFTTVPVSFDQLIATEHAIQAGESCGAIGGSPNAAGALIIVLDSSTPDGDSGIAYLSPGAADPSQTDVSLFVAPAASGQDSASSAVATDGDSETDQDLVEVGDTNTEIPTLAPEPEPTPTPEPDPLGRSAENPAPIGTTVEEDGLAVTINSAYYDYGFANAIPRGGFKVLIMQVTIANNSDGSKSYAASNFSGQDATTGAGYNAVTLDDVGVLLGSGSLDPGEYVTGTVLVEVQETAFQVIVQYDPVMFDPNDLYWLVQ
jgi:hypothetical protein